MNKNLAANWSTASFGSPPDTSPMELAALGDHVDRCAVQRGGLFRLECATEALGRFAAPRLITILVLFAAIGVIASFVL